MISLIEVNKIIIMPLKLKIYIHIKCNYVSLCVIWLWMHICAICNTIVPWIKCNDEKIKSSFFINYKEHIYWSHIIRLALRDGNRTRISGHLLIVQVLNHDQKWESCYALFHKKWSLRFTIIYPNAAEMKMKVTVRKSWQINYVKPCHELW